MRCADSDPNHSPAAARRPDGRAGKEQHARPRQIYVRGAGFDTVGVDVDVDVG
jgi:hypothetical protein